MTRTSVDQRPWHVVHVIGHMRTGGAEKQLANYLLAANRADFRHTLVCLEQPGELAAVVERTGIPVIRMPLRTRFLPWSIQRFAGWMRDQDVSVVHTHMHHAAFWGRLAGLAARVPVLVTTEHGKELWKGPARVAIDRRLSRYTSCHIAVSQEGLEQRIRREHVDPRRIQLIPNGVPLPDLNRFAESRREVRAQLGLTDETPVIGSVGRFIEAKGYAFLVAAVAKVLQRHPTARWLAVGDGDLHGATRVAADECGIGGAVIWAGRRDDVPELLTAMDVWVMSSIREGLPVALLEAMAAGRAIVATNVGGIPDAVHHGEAGLLVPPASPDALADAICQVLENPAAADKLALSARRRAEQEYGIDSVAQRIEDVYRRELRAVFANGSRK
ncbi:MAG: glycosyltransferase [bacterium]|nr:glycosyltransferase [bacterium]